MPRALLLALADREYVSDGTARWSPEHARRFLDHRGGGDMVETTLAALSRSLEPAPFDWLGDRLSTMWMMFMASRTQVDAQALSLWLAEYMRLLAHLPHDVAATAIDRALQTSGHGFIPSVGEICAIGDPLLAERRQIADRLALIVAEGSS